MSYSGISIREVLSKINAPANGWYLPQVQRQYVWGARHESEQYVCLLLDSLVKGYPIGGIVLWETTSAVPYREFIRDYAPNIYAHQVDQGRWGAAKSLIYDGQQRLQTLYSVLLHRFNGRVLHFDLLFDESKEESDETGFLFRDECALPEPKYLRLTELVSSSGSTKDKVELIARSKAAAKGDSAIELLIDTNLTALWDIFATENVKSIAYFSVKSPSSTQVNEVFRRLNTGGVALTQLELLLSKIKAEQSDYEEHLWDLSENIKTKSGGIEFTSSSILQFFHLLVKETVRVDESKIVQEDIKVFQDVLKNDKDALIEFFQGYLCELFGINHSSIVPRWLSVLPIVVYLVARKRKGHKWRIRALQEAELKLIHRYFLLSQFCDWNTQTMVNQFTKLARKSGEDGLMFPFEDIRDIALNKNRTVELHDYQFLSEVWFATKVLMPERTYIFHERKPQVDHIFPLALHGDDDYREAVDILWNFQPVPADLNNYKRATHPKDFFQSEDGKKYFEKYDFLPSLDSVEWDNHERFIAGREERMRNQFKAKYDIQIKSISTTRNSDSM